MQRIIDLSHPVEAGMITYPGLPGPTISDHLSREASRERFAEGVEFHIGRIDLVANTGTYVDAPSHRWAEGADIAGLPLDRLADVPAVLVDAGDGPVTAADLEGLDVAGKAVLVHTGWSRHWRTDRYFEASAPHLTAAAGELLVGNAAALVGIDSVNIDDMTDTRRPVHSVLLEAGVPIVEHLTGLDALRGAGAFSFSAVPAPIVGMGTFPVRAYAIVGRDAR